jgi:S1-C subfamily serine protease
MNRWKTRRLIPLIFLSAHILISPHLAAQNHRKPTLSTQELVASVRKSLVLVLTQDRAGNAIAQGSGFFVRSDLVATNIHVLKRASQGYVKSAFDGTRYKISSVVGFDLKHDLCVLKLSGVAGTALPLSQEMK